MKNFITLFITISLLAVSSGTSLAQDAQDKVTMLNGDEHIGKVTAMDAATIKFIHQNETLSYSYEKSDIHKIQFSSGRIEVLNEISTASNVSLQDHHNVVTVIPFTFIGDGGVHNEQLELKAQTDCYNVLKNFAKDFKIQDPITTNALLKKHNIDGSNIDGFTPDELCHILGAEYVVFGGITVLFTGSISSSSASQTKKNRDSKTTSYTVGSAYTVDNYKTEVSLNIYNDQGNNIYSKSHNSFWQTQDAYEITLQWIVKRSPLYRK